MPTAVITYNLSDEDDAQAYRVALGGQQMLTDLWNLLQAVRQMDKYEDERTMSSYDLKEFIYEHLNASTIELLN